MGGSRDVDRATVGTPEIEGYDLVDLIRRTSRSAIFLARQLRLDRLVEVEVDDRPAVTPRPLASMQMTRHPHLAEVLDAGSTTDGRPFLATEHLDRGTLADVVADVGPMSPRLAARTTLPVADALATLHRRGVAHGHVAPETVLVGAGGRVKLRGPGFDRDPSATPAGDVAGLAATIRAVLAPGDPVPAPLAAVLQRATAETPATRPSIDELRTSLAAVGTGGGDGATTAVLAVMTTPPEPGRRRRGTPYLIAALAVVGLALGAGVIAATRDGGDESGDAPPSATSTPVTVAPTAPAAPTASTAATTPATSALAPATEPTVATAGPAPTTTPATAAPPTIAEPAPPPPAATAAPPTEPAPSAAPAAFLEDYFALVDEGRYDVTWPMLTAAFQEGRAQSYEYYSSFWDDNDVGLLGATVVREDPEEAVVDATLRWNGRSTTVERFDLVVVDGEYRIARQRTVG